MQGCKNRFPQIIHPDSYAQPKFDNCTRCREDVFNRSGSQVPSFDKMGQKRMSFLVVHDISDPVFSIFVGT